MQLSKIFTALWLSATMLAAPAYADNASDVAAAVNDLYVKLDSGDSAGFGRYLLPDGFNEFNPDKNVLQQLDMKYFNYVFKSGAKIDLHVSDLKVKMIGDTGVVTGYRVGSITPPSGAPIESKLALTMIWTKVAGEWKLFHVHMSTVKS